MNEGALTRGCLPAQAFEHLEPTAVGVLDLDRSGVARAPDDREFSADDGRDALLLVRLHEDPLGLVHLAGGELSLAPDQLASWAWQAARDEISHHILRCGCSRELASCPNLPVPQVVATVAVIIPTVGRARQLERCWTGPIKLIQASKYRDRITLVNHYVSNGKVSRWFAGADIVALPYRRSSASGPPHLTMDAGLPVVVTDVGGLGEASDGYEGAVLVPAADPEALAEGLGRAVSLRGRRYEDTGCWGNNADAVLALLRELNAHRESSVAAVVRRVG